MAPLKPIKEDKGEQRVQTILESSKRISDCLRDREELPTGFRDELDSLIKRSFPLPSSPALTEKASELDRMGVELWNAATNIIRRNNDGQNRSDGPGGASLVGTLLRTFAFFLIDAAYHATSKREKDGDQFMRNFKIALKTCRLCLQVGELELADKVIERCSEHVAVSETDSPIVRIFDSGEDEHRAHRKAMVVEFYLYRMSHACKIERFDMAEHHFNQIPMHSLSGSQELSEKAADLFYEAGKVLVRGKKEDTAIVWFERAISVLDSCALEYQSQDAAELRLSLSSSLVQCLLNANDLESAQRARNVVHQLSVEHGFGKRMIVQLMQLRVTLAEQPVHQEELKEIVSRIVRSAILNDRTFRSVMQAIHQARRVDTEIAFSALKEMITRRLLPNMSGDEDDDSAHHAFLETACVTYTLFATDHGIASRTTINDLQKTFDAIVQHSHASLSPKAIHAAQTLIWKASGVADPKLAELWCTLMQHALFDRVGHVNKSKVARKSITMALARNDVQGARQYFFQMPEAVRNESATRYLAFKLALRTHDYDLARECLSIISRQASKDQSLLYACVLEAQQSEMRPVAVAALQAILDKKPPEVHLPTLLRCTVKLLMKELEANEQHQEGVTNEIVTAFENAAGNMSAFIQSTDEVRRADIQWWSKNAYNLSLKHCVDMNPEYLVRLLNVCTRFIDVALSDSTIAKDDNLNRRKALCHFICTNALVAQARSTEAGSEYSLQCYLQARSEIEAFRGGQASGTNQQDNDMQAKHFELLKLDLECILNLQQWSALNASLQACLDFQPLDRWENLADTVLTIRQHIDTNQLDSKSQERMNEILERIINDTWLKDKNITKASRWLRLAFFIDLKDHGGDFALKLLSQAANMAKKGYGKDEGTGAYPETELQWLATTAFNRAIDLVAQGNVEALKEWMDASLEMARYSADNGALHANLTDKKERVLDRVKDMNF